MMRCEDDEEAIAADDYDDDDDDDGFYLSINRHNEIWGAADEAVLNKKNVLKQ